MDNSFGKPYGLEAMRWKHIVWHFDDDKEMQDSPSVFLAILRLQKTSETPSTNSCNFYPSTNRSEKRCFGNLEKIFTPPSVNAKTRSPLKRYHLPTKNLVLCNSEVFRFREYIAVAQNWLTLKFDVSNPDEQNPNRFFDTPIWPWPEKLAEGKFGLHNWTWREREFGWEILHLSGVEYSHGSFVKKRGDYGYTTPLIAPEKYCLPICGLFFGGSLKIIKRFFSPPFVGEDIRYLASSFMREPQHVIDAGHRHIMITLRHTVDGGNPANQLIGSFNPNIYMVFYIPGGAVFLSSAVCLRNRSGIHFHQSELSWWLSLSCCVKRETHQRDASKWGFIPGSLYRSTIGWPLCGGLKLSRSKPQELLPIGLIEKFSKESLTTFGLLLCCVAQESQTLNWSTEGLLVEKDFRIEEFLVGTD